VKIEGTALYYFKSEKDFKKGKRGKKIDLNKAEIAKGKEEKGKFWITITTHNKRMFEIAAKSKKDCSAWIAKLKLVAVMSGSPKMKERVMKKVEVEKKPKVVKKDVVKAESTGKERSDKESVTRTGESGTASESGKERLMKKVEVEKKQKVVKKDVVKAESTRKESSDKESVTGAGESGTASESGSPKMKERVMKKVEVEKKPKVVKKGVVKAESTESSDKESVTRTGESGTASESGCDKKESSDGKERCGQNLATKTFNVQAPSTTMCTCGKPLIPKEEQLSEKTKAFDLNAFRAQVYEEIAKRQNLDRVSESDLKLMLHALKEEKKSRKTCVVCLDKVSVVICLPCAHLCLCEECSGNHLLVCPMCRMDINQLKKVYT